MKTPLPLDQRFVGVSEGLSSSIRSRSHSEQSFWLEMSQNV